MQDSAIHIGTEKPVPESPGILLQGFALVCLFSLVVLSALELQGDTDLWWHLATGQWIGAHHAVPFTDPFTSFGQGQRWFAYSWLFEVVLYNFYQVGGLAGVVGYTILMNVLITALLFYLVRARLNNFLYSVGLTAWASLAMANIHTPRPWLMTILFFLLELMILDEVRRRGKFGALLGLIPLFVVWANVHIQFILGLGVLLLYAVEPILQKFTPKLGLVTEDCRTPRLGIWICLAGAVGATLVNPYGAGVYSVIWEYVSQHNVPFAAIMELQAPTFRTFPDWAALGLILTGMFALGRKKALPVTPTLLLLAGTLFYFRATRDVWFPAIAGALILAEAIPAEMQTRSNKTNYFLLIPAIALGVGLIVLISGRGRFLSNSVLEAGLAKKFPVAAADYVAQHRLTGRIFNHFNWGGYLIWRFPEGRVTLDGRTNLHGEARLDRIGDTWAGSPKWSQDPELLAADLVIAERGMPLTTLLRTAPQFKVLWEGENAVVFVKQGP